jgi:hypothetical protein
MDADKTLLRLFQVSKQDGQQGVLTQGMAYTQAWYGKGMHLPGPSV